MLDYPQTPREELVETLHGIPVPDPYRWLEETDSSQTQNWLAAQNRLTEEFLSRIPVREKIRRRVSELWDYEKYGVPFRRKDRYFFTLQQGLQNQSALYWTAGLAGKPQLLLDPNGLSEDGTVALMGYSASNDGSKLAYGLSSAGSDWQEWRVRQVESGADLDDRLDWIKYTNVCWTTDDQGFFYSRYDQPQEGAEYKAAQFYHKLYYHRLGTPQDDDRLIYQRPDQKEWRFFAEVSEDGRYLILSVHRGTQQENGVFYRDLQVQDAPMVELLSRFDAHYTFIGNDGPRCYFATDLEAPRSRVIAIDLEDPDRSHWQEIIPEAADTLQEVHLSGDSFIVSYLHDARSQVKIYHISGRETGAIELPTPGTASGFSGRLADKETFFHFTSFTMPGTIFRHELEAGQSTVFRQPRLTFDPDEYVIEQVFYSSKDGTQVPMSLGYKRGLSRNGQNPTYLYGYGGFAISLTPQFSVAQLAWMEMGGLCAWTNLRGGGEYGRPWHEAGTKLHKQNVFDDFIAAAEWLSEQRYTCREKLAIGGRSNGGLLVGACLTQRPELYRACLPAVGVLDMLRFHKFTVGWGWVSDYGSPEDPEEFKALLAYSPYHNVRAGTSYPATLVCTGDHDDRVFPAHSFKFAAALQAAQEGEAPILIRIETRAGHGLGKPSEKLIAEISDQWAFLVWALEMKV